VVHLEHHQLLIIENFILDNLLDQGNLLVNLVFLFEYEFSLFLFVVEVYEGIYRKYRVAIKVLKEANSATFFLREADIMR
jgi:hypothetical protein